MALPFDFTNNPLVGANPLTPTYPTTGGPLPMATGTPQPMATGTTGYTLPNYGSMGANPYAFSSPAMMTGTGRDRVASAYNTAIGAPQTQSFNYGGNQYGITFGAGMTPAEINRLMTEYAGAGQRVFNPSDALRQYYGYQNDLARMQAAASSGQQASDVARLDRFIDKNLPAYTMTFTPGTEGGVNPYVREYEDRRMGPGQTRRSSMAGLLG